MHWLALRWLAEPAAPPDEAPHGAGEGGALPAVPLSSEALGWWALQFTPHVTWLEEALLLEVCACERLWGGRRALMRQMQASRPAGTRIQQAQGATSLAALARLRMFADGQAPPPPAAPSVPGALPLATLTAAQRHLEVLARMGCRTWGQAAALPRAGLVRRFGPELREALDIAWGLRPECHAWLTPPEVFDQRAELPALATSAPELLWSAQRLLAALRIWLQARQRGVLAIELAWTLDLKRLNGADLPRQQQLQVRTAEPTQDMTHLRRLLAERLALTPLVAPTGWLHLRSLETVPWGGAMGSFLPPGRSQTGDSALGGARPPAAGKLGNRSLVMGDGRTGEPLHQLVEKLSARLGPQQVLRARPQADHRPERMQAWEPAVRAHPEPPAAPAPAGPGACLLPHWVLREPVELEVRGERPQFQGPLRLRVGPQRLEGDGWWEEGVPAERDYYVAESPGAGLVWIYRERPAGPHADRVPRWFLQGLYA